MLELGVFEEFEDVEGSVLVLERLAKIGLQLLYEFLAELWVESRDISFDVQQSRLGYLLIHIDEIKLGLPPVLEVLQK